MWEAPRPTPTFQVITTTIRTTTHHITVIRTTADTAVITTEVMVPATTTALAITTTVVGIITTRRTTTTTTTEVTTHTKSVTATAREGHTRIAITPTAIRTITGRTPGRRDGGKGTKDSSQRSPF